MILYSPVGLKELELIEKRDFKEFPPRMYFQATFYALLNFEHAEQIAREWNTTDRNLGFAGFVTKFEVENRYISRFRVRTAGTTQHQEIWIPAERLDTFNKHIIGDILVVAAYYGPNYQGEVRQWLR